MIFVKKDTIPVPYCAGREDGAGPITMKVESADQEKGNRYNYEKGFTGKAAISGRIMDQTLNYYKENAAGFAAGTVNADLSETQERFLTKLQPGAAILDLGCGSGRDTKVFLARGYRVTAADGSPELCRIASAYTGIPVRLMLFNELADAGAYDGIWACASILHVPSAELPDVFRRMITALRPGGIIYASFKYGTFEGERNGRRFTDFTGETFAAFLKQFPELTLEDQWISADVRPGRSDEKWLNVILRKDHSASLRNASSY